MFPIRNRAEVHQWIFTGLLITTAIGMQFSHFLVSISIILMSANYLAEGCFKTKFQRLIERKPVALFVGLFALHIAGYFWSIDTAYAARDIQIKLPLLALSVVIGTSEKIPKNHFEWVLLFFIATSLLSTIVGSVIYFALSQTGDDYRNMSPMMSHIRLSLMMGVAMYSAIYLGCKSKRFRHFKKWLFGLAAWFWTFMLMLRAMSGIVAVLASAFVLLWMISSHQKIRFHQWIKSIIVSVVLLLGGYVYWQIQAFYDITEIDLNHTDTHSKGGERYYFDPDIKLVENGNYVYAYIAFNELKDEWNKCSKYPIDSLDIKGQPIETTLIRYLTSKNLPKDREGIQALTHLDIWAVENGIANVRFLNDKSFNTMIYRYIWEIHNFIHGFNPQGNSLGQRFLFWKLGTEIFINNLWKGVGTGDVQLAFNKKYDGLPFNVRDKYRLRAHNQYLTMGITFGVFGLIYFVLAMISGLLDQQGAKSYFFVGFFIIFMVSMLDEDTLETQFGVTFASYFYFLLLYQLPYDK